jgi:starch synthase
MANSDYTRQQTLAAYPEIPPQRIITVYKSVNTELFSGERSHSPDPIGRKFVFVGSNIKIKRLHIAVQAFSLMDSPHSTLDIAGCEREEFVRLYPGLKKQVDDLRVTFHGRLPRLAVKELLLRSDVLLQPSRQEALGVALIEAIACGCRVLASNCGGMPEIVKGGHIGVLINDSTPHAWANAMIRELTCPGLDNNAKQEVLENFGTEKMIGTIRKLYKDNLS